MPFRDNQTHFRDILESIEHIEMFLEEMDFEAYQADAKTKSAVERQMQIITEAAYRLGDEAVSLCPGPDWEGLRGMGNILRHAYHRVDDKIVWDTVRDELPPIKDAVLKVLNEPLH
ncbi:MAG: HepT-like ribonuclease domain-containing protein [Terracidiphilus sp.]